MFYEQPVELREDMSYEEEPAQILDMKEQELRNKTISLMKVIQRQHGGGKSSLRDKRSDEEQVSLTLQLIILNFKDKIY